MSGSRFGKAAWTWISAPSRRFVPLFLVFLWLLTTLVGRLPKAAIDRLLEGTAWTDARLLALFLDDVTRHGTIVRYDGFAVEVITECTGLYEAVILCAAVLAYRASWRERALGIVLGTALLYVVNVLRIAFLLVIGRHAPGLFDLAHVYLWQTLLAVFITVIWLIWIHYLVRDAPRPPVRA